MTPFEATLLACLFIAAFSIVWSALATGISPMPSSRKARRAMLAAVALSEHGTIIDLGAGWGTLAIACATCYPQRRVVGYELSWLPWLVSLLLKHALRLHNLTLHRGDFLHADLSQAAVLLCYLFPRGMRQLHAKLRCEQVQVDLLISNTFALPSCETQYVARLDDLYSTPVYVYARPIAAI